jgi:pimeloyl-ACP methyl ester carboxylesterase
MKQICSLFVFIAACACSTYSPDEGVMQEVDRATETPMTFEAASGDSVTAFEGSFTVPENRANPQSRILTLRYVRFPATGDAAGPPIIYLAGGPGGSGIQTAKGRRFPLFMAMREFGDVIAFDQRGTGASNDLPNCVSSQYSPDDAELSDSAFLEMQKEAFKECLAFWKSEGVDVRGYNTLESVADLDALREALGAEAISLWGISYGSHLSLAALKDIDANIDRIVIASAEGLDQTIKLPARTDAYFKRLQDAINTQPAAKEMFSDIIGLMRHVHAQLEEEPLMLQIPQSDGSSSPYLFHRRDMQRIASAMISDPQSASMLIQLYGAIAAGMTDPVAGLVSRFHTPNEPISYSPMSVLMDVSSGTGAERRELIEEQARTSLLASFLNQPVELEDVDPSLVLGDEFRKAPVSDTPILVLSGTLDGRTYVESQHEAVSGLRNRQMITVVNAGHNLFMASPEVTEAIQRFMRGETLKKNEIIVELPDFSSIPGR